MNIDQIVNRTTDNLTARLFHRMTKEELTDLITYVHLSMHLAYETGVETALIEVEGRIRVANYYRFISNSLCDC